MRFLIDTKIDDLGQILSEFRKISHIWEPKTHKRMKIDPYCQRRICSPFNVPFWGVL